MRTKTCTDGTVLRELADVQCTTCGPNVPVFADELGEEYPYEGDDGLLPIGTMIVSTHNCGGGLIYSTPEDKIAD